MFGKASHGTQLQEVRVRALRAVPVSCDGTHGTHAAENMPDLPSPQQGHITQTRAI